MIETEPLIGIWWDDTKTLITFAHSWKTHAEGKEIKDSLHMHAECWDEIAKRFGLTRHDEYFLIPRGRVLYDTRNQRSLILHGAATSSERLQVIAEKFQLTNWVSRMDDHYQIGEVADALFNDWFDDDDDDFI